MFSKVRQRLRKNPSKVTDNPPSFDNSQQIGASTIDTDEQGTTDREALKDPQESSIEAIQINARLGDDIYSVGFLADGKYVVSAGKEGEIRKWRVEDGEEIGTSTNAGSPVCDLVVSRDGEWIVSGTRSGRVTVWNATTRCPQKVTEFQAHKKAVYAVDTSPDGTKIATGSHDKTVCVWSLSTGQQLLRSSLEHDFEVIAVKFSPDGQFIATATWNRNSVRVYDVSQVDGRLLADFSIQVDSPFNRSIAWANDANRLFVLSSDAKVHCLDVSTRKTLSTWCIHSSKDPNCITLACNDRIIAASADSSFSFWDTKTHQQIGTVINHSDYITSMAISANYDIATGGYGAIALRNLCEILPSPYRSYMLREREIWRSTAEKTSFESQAQSIRVRDARQAASISSIEKTAEEFLDQLALSNEEKEILQDIIQALRIRDQTSIGELNKIIDSLHMDLDAQKASSAQQIANLKQSVRELRVQFAASQRALRIRDMKHECEISYAHGRTYDAARRLLEVTNTMSKDLMHDEPTMHWLEEFTHQCVSRLQTIGDEALGAAKQEEALSAYSAILSLVPSPPNSILIGWARTALRCHSADEVLRNTSNFKVAKFYVHRTVYDILEGDDRAMEAIECFQRMKNEPPDEAPPNDQAQWELEFQQRCIKKVVEQGDATVNSKNHDAAIGYYSSALALDPTDISIIVKCCKARIGFLETELTDATMVTECQPLSYEGCRRKHSILYSMGRYKEAFDAFKMMLLRMEKSPDPQVRNLQDQYLDTTPLIRNVIEQTIRDIPRALIDTNTGRLHDKTLQAAAFEETHVFNELRSSMVTRGRLDYARIEREVEKFYQYVMFSHRWQLDEPTFQLVENISIYGLPASLTNNKLIHFCHLVRSRRFRWAWSDTCCVNQADNRIQQESVVAMFRWYCRAALTIVHLLGVLSESQQKGSLWKSIWNTRGWTYQEYVASKVIQFYTEDWKPYLGLEMFNHKESPVILSEMEQATNFATQELAKLQPGLHRVREKLYLASRRQTTREEDIAYSLFGIFDVAIPVIYGEGKQAVRRLLEHILTRSDNVTLLSWTGYSGSSTDSYLPADLTVYDQIQPPHVPRPIKTAEMDRRIRTLHWTLPDISLAPELYKQLYNITPLSLVAGRLRLPGFVFPLANLSLIAESESGLRSYNATAPTLGDVLIETKDNLAVMQGLLLIHPWISPLLDEDFSGSNPLCDLPTRALRFVVRLRQPFGALLLASQGRVQYKRVATDSLIEVQIRAGTMLKELMDSVRTVDVQ